MEAIPYTVEPRPDTGLYNAKLGMWMFLASEVMLFGALFSAYVLLRSGSPDWPHGPAVLNVPLATLNTIVLITSSVTMVLSWAALKMKDLRKFRLFMAATVLLALAFLVVKYFEYSAKFEHDAVTLKDGTVVTGHIESRDKSQVVIHPDAAHGAPGAPAIPASLSRYAVPAPSGEAAHGAAGMALTIPMKEVRRVTAFGPDKDNYMGLYFGLTGLHGLHILGGILVNLWLLVFGVRMWKTEPVRFTNRVEVAGLYWHFVDLVWIFLFPVLYLL